ELVTYAITVLKKVWRDGYAYKKAGVIVTGIVPETNVQAALFDTTDRSKHALAMEALDKVNKRYGKNTVSSASQGVNRNWKLRQDYLSAHFTTRWGDIIKVRV
ncbi:MAG TPA: DUF4113 domain-containing protein, partial [Chitinophagales bacterium]|nr:DUF4113 domain-containing protein [Chitinophagales bacterium]